MRQSPWRRRGRQRSDAVRLVGALLAAGGMIILWRLLPVWLLWGLVAAVLVAIGLVLVFG